MISPREIGRSPALMLALFLSLVGMGVGAMFVLKGWGNGPPPPVWWVAAQWACGGAAMTLVLADLGWPGGALKRIHWALGLLAASVFLVHTLIYAALVLVVLGILMAALTSG